MDSDKALELAIQFARHNFDNHQALIRSSDTKAGVMVTIMVFLAASALPISKDAVAKLHLRPCHIAASGAVFLLATAALLGSVLWLASKTSFKVRRSWGSTTIPCVSTAEAIEHETGQARRSRFSLDGRTLGWPERRCVTPKTLQDVV